MAPKLGEGTGPGKAPFRYPSDDSESPFRQIAGVRRYILAMGLRP
jgi:hypothetical protein